MLADFLLAAALVQAPVVPVEIIPPPFCAPGPPIVYFERGDDQVSPQAQAVLDNIAQPFLLYPVNTPIVVTGHTDSAGGAAANMSLSRRRAANVRKYLNGLGIPAFRLVVEAKGESEPYPGEPDGKLNRRVSVLERISDEERARRSAAWPQNRNMVC
jgi:OmpA-OmpF porin, OOP family